MSLSIDGIRAAAAAVDASTATGEPGASLLVWARQAGLDPADVDGLITDTSLSTSAIAIALQKAGCPHSRRTVARRRDWLLNGVRGV